MFSVVHEGKVLDFHYKKLPQGYIYVFYIGDILIGQIFRHSEHNWHGVSFYKDIRGSMGGFGSRYHASEYLLKICGFN